MKLIELHPEWAGINDPSRIIDEMSMDALIPLMTATADYYNKNLPLWAVLNSYGCDTVDASTTDGYVSCKLLSHSSADQHASARYFTVDRNTGESRPAVHCYKCQRNLTSFWYFYTMEKEWNEITSPKELYKLIWTRFRLPPPLDLWFNFDASVYFEDFDGKTTSAPDPTPFFQEALRIRDLKYVDPALYLQRLAALLQSAPSVPSS